VQDWLSDQMERERKEYVEEVLVEDQEDFYWYHKMMKLFLLDYYRMM
jgi:hypothetical protein